jgi:hypothetical protein
MTNLSSCATDKENGLSLSVEGEADTKRGKSRDPARSTTEQDTDFYATFFDYFSRRLTRIERHAPRQGGP